MTTTKLPALSTAPILKDSPQVTRWLNNVKTILENIDLNATSADIVVTDQQIADLVAAGLKGDAGTAGAPGVNGQTSYFHIAYADSADGSTNFNQTSGVYIGTYVDFISSDSPTFTDYEWSKFEGTDGIAGSNGVNGETSYLHIKYSPDGVAFSGNNGEDIDAWLGQYVDFTLADSLVFNDYSWQKIEGDPGVQGPQGDDGIASYFYTAYANDSVGSTGFSLTWSNQTYLGTYTSASATQSTDPASYTWVLIKGVDGAGIPPTSATPSTPTAPFVVSSRTFSILNLTAVPIGDESQYLIIYRNAVDDPLTANIIGTTKTLIYQDYTANDGDYYYWVATQSEGSIATPEGITGPKSITTGTSHVTIDSKITNTNINEYFATGAIGTDYMFATTLAAFQANLGDVTAGTLTNSTGTFLIDLVSSFIRIAGGGGYLADDYILIENGKIIQKRWTGTTHQEAESLSVIESDLASNGATVTLGKYYKTQPQISVSPYDTPIYKAANSAQDQSIQIRAENIIESPSGSGTWQFDAISRLVLSSGSTATPVNDTFNGSTQIITSGAGSPYLTPANSSDVTITVDLTSIRGTGISGQYYNRTVTWTTFYRAAGSSDSYLSVSGGATVFGDSILPVTDSQLVTFSSSGSWEFYIEGDFTDNGGSTFSTAGIQYDELTHERTATDIYATITEDHGQFINLPLVGSTSTPSNPTLAGFSNTSGYTTYEIEYSWNYGYYMNFTRTGTGESGTSIGGSIQATDKTTFTTSRTNTQVWNFTYGVSGATQAVSHSSGVIATSTYDQNYISGSISANWDVDGTSGNVQAVVSVAQKFTNMKATIKERKPQTNSSIADNTLEIVSFDYQLSGFSELNAGTLRWLAIL